MRVQEVSGFLSEDPKEKLSKNGIKYITFSLPNQEHREDETYWYNCYVWDNSLMKFAQSLKKGSYIAVHGNYSDRIYDSTKTGKPAIARDIRVDAIYSMGSAKKDSIEQSNDGQEVTVKEKVEAPIASKSTVNIDNPKPEDDLPF